MHSRMDDTLLKPWPAQPFLHATPLDNLELPSTLSGEGIHFTLADPGRLGRSMSWLLSIVWLAA